MDEKKFNLTQTGQQVQDILNSAKSTDQVLTEIQEAMENLHDGQAVSAQVALNTVAIQELDDNKASKTEVENDYAKKTECVFDISAYHATGTPPVLATYDDLAAALGTDGANIPEALRKGGMSVKFVHTFDNKYVQYRLMANTFSTNESDWQGVDDEPTTGSENFVKSGGVKTFVENQIKSEAPIYTTGYILGFNKRVKELYLTGLDNSHSYYVYNCYFKDGGVSFRIKDATTDTVVVRAYPTAIPGLVRLQEQNSSGVGGYAVIDIISSDTNDIKGTDLTLINGVVSNVDFSPTIKSYLEDSSLTALVSQTKTELENKIIQNNIPLQENIIRTESIACTGSSITNTYTLVKDRIYRFYFLNNWTLSSGRKVIIQKYTTADAAYGAEQKVNYNKDIAGMYIDVVVSDWYDSTNQFVYGSIKVTTKGDSGQTAKYNIIDITDFVKSQARIEGVVTDITPKASELTFGVYCSRSGVVSSNANTCKTTNPISFNAGDTILFYNISGTSRTLFVAKDNEIRLMPVLSASTISPGTISYTFHEKCNVYLSYSFAASDNCRIYKITPANKNVLEPLYITPDGYPSVVHKGHISPFCTDVVNGIYSSFDIAIPTNDLLHVPLILNVRAKYKKTIDTDEYPTLNIYNEIYYGHAESYTKYCSQTYRLGYENEFVCKSYRLIVPPPECAYIRVAVNIPEGIELSISDFSASYQQGIQLSEIPYIVDDHGITGAFCTMSNITKCAIHGFKSCIVVPKVTSDGVWCCFHDDDNINGLYYPNGQVVCANNNGVYTQYDEQGNVIGNSAMPVSSVTWEFLSGLVYQTTIYNNSHVMKMTDFFEVCLKTGVSPIFSIHPDINKQGMYSLLKQYGLLSKAIFLIGVNSLSSYYEVFGNKIGGYSIFPTEETVAGVQSAIAALVDYPTENGKYWIEVLYDRNPSLDDTARKAIIDEIADSTKVVDGVTISTGIKSYFVVNGDDSEVMRKLMLWGCNRFCSNNMFSYGLNW